MGTRFFLVSALVALLGAPGLAIDHPLEGDKLRVREASPERRTFFFRAGHELQLIPGNIADPTIAGATLRVFGDGAGDGDSGILFLPPENWRPMGKPAGSKGYYYLDRTAAVGVNKVRIMQCENTGGSLKISARGSAWPYSVTQPQGTIRVQLTIADRTYCARLSDLQPNAPGKIVGKKNPAPPDCN